MQKLSHIKSVYFVGVGGIGMSALARFCLHQEMQVYGYDKTESALTKQLTKEGVSIYFEDSEASLPEVFQAIQAENLVVLTPAIPKGNKVLQRLLSLGYVPIKRAAFLGMISRTHYTLAVAGTHGKTTTSTLLAHIMYESGYQMLGILGGLSTNYTSNYLIQAKGKQIEGKPVLVTEADEFDRSFLHLSPDIGVVTSTDADHLDIYGKPQDLLNSFQAFTDLIADTAILEQNVVLNHKKQVHYGNVSENAYNNLRNEKGNQYFDCQVAGVVYQQVKAGLPGRHNVENALAAILAATRAGAEIEQALKSVGSFKGVKRRFEKVFESESKVIIDDYAHHPAELNAIISAVRSLYPNRKMSMVFQPHLFSRTRDFMDAFAEALSHVDSLIINPIYPAREKPIEGITSEALLARVNLENKRVLTREESVKQFAVDQPQLLVIAGAGSIDRIVEPIVKSYKDAEPTA